MNREVVRPNQYKRDGAGFNIDITSIKELDQYHAKQKTDNNDTFDHLLCWPAIQYDRLSLTDRALYRIGHWISQPGADT